MNGRRAADDRQGIKLILELTNLCNFSCTHCIRSEEEPTSFLSVDLVRKVLAQVRAYRNVSLVALTGGEPTLHPRFGEILGLVTGAGFRFGFVTNGWQFVSRTFPDVQPHRAHCAHVTFSLDGATEPVHDELRRRPGSFRRVLQGVALCRAHGIPAHLNMVVTRSNRAQLESMALLANRIGCDALFYGHCQPTPDAVAAGLTLSVPERLEVEAEIAELQRIFQLPILLAGDHWEPTRFHQCPQLQMRELNVDYRGNLTACCVLSGFRGGARDTDVIADLETTSFYEAHQRLVSRIARLNHEKIERLANGPEREQDHFICTHCLEHYGKVAGPERAASLPVLPASARPVPIPRIGEPA